MGFITKDGKSFNTSKKKKPVTFRVSGTAPNSDFMTMSMSKYKGNGDIMARFPKEPPRFGHRIIEHLNKDGSVRAVELQVSDMKRHNTESYKSMWLSNKVDNPDGIPITMVNESFAKKLY